MLQDMWNAPPPPGFRPTKSAPASPAKPIGVLRTRSESFHAIHKVPIGDSPYVRAKNVQLVEKDPERAIPLFWAAINAGDRVDSALKDMAIVMKQQNRADEAIEAIKSLRSRCSDQAQESLDNILLDLYKRCGRLDDQIGLLKRKLFLIQQGFAFNGKRTKTARSQGKKFQVSVEQEATRLLGNLGWALMQQDNYMEAEDAYRRALSIAPDNNKMCNLGICLMKQGRIGEAKDMLRQVKPAVSDGPRGVDSHLKAYERAQQMLNDLESEMMTKGGADRVEQRRLFDAFLGSSSIWQPQPCKEHNINNTIPKSISSSSKVVLLPNNNNNNNDGFADENAAANSIMMLQQRNMKHSGSMSQFANSLSIDAQPYYSAKTPIEPQPVPPIFNQTHENLKRTRSGNAANPMQLLQQEEVGDIPKMPLQNNNNNNNNNNNKPRRKLSLSLQEDNLTDQFLPDSKDFEQAIIASVLGESTNASGIFPTKKIDKRLKVFRDITLSFSPTPRP